MRVLYVCADRGIPVLGHKGASVHVRSLTAAMQRIGHEVTLAARSLGEGNAPPDIARMVKIDAGRPESRLDRLISESPPDVVIERYSLQSGATRELTLEHGIPFTLEVNAPLAAEATRYRGLEDPAAECREHDTLRAADRIHVVSRALEAYVRSVAPAVPCAWIPNGVDVARFRRHTPVLQGSQVLIGFAGSMKPWHGVEQLLEAFAILAGPYPDARLRLIGSGPQEHELRQRTALLGLERRVELTGAVPHAEVPERLADCHFAVAPYLPMEDFYFQPLKVVEYLAAAKPIVYADQGDLSALVGSAGVGYTPGSLPALTDGLEVVLGDHALRERMATAATERATFLDWSAVAARLVRFAVGEIEADGDRLLGVDRV